MTDNEIIQALKCCYDLDSSAICHQCPLYQTEECRDGYLGLQAYRLINHQQAEIERLEKIRKADNNLITSLNKCYETAKAEAIKKFISCATDLCYKEFENDLEVTHTFASILTEAQKEMLGEE